MPSALLCRLLDHVPDRGRAWSDGIGFRSVCKRCGAPMLRDVGAWRLYSDTDDADPRRAAHRDDTP
ncbi:MAG: hypothetical protein V4537_04040 [Pseudomonadota bacterium]